MIVHLVSQKCLQSHFYFVQTSCKLRAKLRATFLKKNESEQRITHSLGTSVTRLLYLNIGFVTLFQKLRAKLRAVTGHFLQDFCRTFAEDNRS